MKSIMPDLIGNKTLSEKIGNEILSGGLSHAYIISGARGTGKHTLARLIAASIVCENKDKDGFPLPCHRCENCRKIFSGIAHDIGTVGLPDDRTTIGVDAVRELKYDVSKGPIELPLKVYIMENADKMTAQAQNAFLLTLEDPPPYVMFLLLCEHPEDLLETVRSRAPILRTEPLDAKSISEFLASNEATLNLMKSAPDEFAEIIMAADGSIGQALELSKPENREHTIKVRAHAKKFLCAAAGRPSGETLIALIDDFPQKSRQELLERITLISIALRDLIVLKRSEDAPLCFYHSREEALELSDKFTLSALISLLSACNEAKSATLRNANVKITVTNLVMRGIHGK